MAKYDVVVVVEAHGTDGGAKVWWPPIGCSAWWSAGLTAGSAGVGIVIKDSFLGNFENRPVWTAMWPGRAAKLAMRGSQGTVGADVGAAVGPAVGATVCADVGAAEVQQWGSSR